MNKTEYQKCEKLMYEAISNAKQSQEEYRKSEKFLKDGNKVEWEIKQWQGDQHFGYVRGINQVLVTIGFKHDDMKKLSDLI